MVPGSAASPQGSAASPQGSPAVVPGSAASPPATSLTNPEMSDPFQAAEATPNPVIVTTKGFGAHGCDNHGVGLTARTRSGTWRPLP
jgi:hypothetical protein